MRMPKLKEKRQFKREYIPVIITGAFLVILIAALVIAILYKIPDPKVTIDGSESNVDDLLVDTRRLAKDQKVYDEFVEKAKKIGVTYTLKDDLTVGYDYPDGYEGDMSLEPPQTEEFAIKGRYFEIILDNVDPSIYLVLSDSKGANKENVLTFKDNEDKLKMDMAFVDEVMTYTIEVRKTEAPDQGILLRKFSFKTPKFNYFSEMMFCSQHPDDKYCVETTFKDISIEQFNKEVNKVLKNDTNSLYNKAIQNNKNINNKNNDSKIEKEEKSFFENIIEFIKKNKIICIIVCVVIIFGVAATIILFKRKKKGAVIE